MLRRYFSGSYIPADYEENDTFLAPAPTNNYAANLLIYNGISPNGTWSLFISDDQLDAGGSIANGWSLQFEYAPATPPSITDVQNLGNNGFQFTLNGEPSLIYSDPSCLTLTTDSSEP